jgi:hypothetical protein
MASRDSPAGKRLRYRLENLGVWVTFPVGARDVSLLHNVQTGPGAHPAPGVKRQGWEADHSPPSSAEVKYNGAIPPLLLTYAWCNV